MYCIYIQHLCMFSVVCVQSIWCMYIKYTSYSRVCYLIVNSSRNGCLTDSLGNAKYPYIEPAKWNHLLQQEHVCIIPQSSTYAISINVLYIYIYNIGKRKSKKPHRVWLVYTTHTHFYTHTHTRWHASYTNIYKKSEKKKTFKNVFEYTEKKNNPASHPFVRAWWKLRRQKGVLV